MIGTTDKLWHLERFSVIQVLSMEERKELGDLATMKSYKKGEKIYLPSNACNYVYFLKEGNIRISRITYSANEQVTDIIGPGELFGKYAFDTDNKNQEIATALKDTIICYFHLDDWNHYIVNHGKFSITVLKLMHSKVRCLEMRIEQLQFLNVTERVKTVLKELADKHAKVMDRPNRLELKLNLTHKDIAMLSGTSRQSVTTELGDLQRKGIVSYDRYRIIIEDYNQL